MNRGHQDKSIRRYLRLQGAGGLLLAICWFLPAVETCGSKPDVPFQEIRQIHWGSIGKELSEAVGAGQWAASFCQIIVDSLTVFYWYVAAYMFGGLVLLGAIRRLRLQAEATVGAATTGFTWFVVISWPLMIVLSEFRSLVESNKLWWDGDLLYFLPLIIFLGAYMWFAYRSGRARHLCIRWYLAGYAIIWFGMYFVLDFQDTHYGLWLSLAASLLIWITCLGEVRVLHVCGWFTALARLARCQIWALDLDQPRCRKCGYFLIGLTTNRCPECGLVISDDMYPAPNPPIEPPPAQTNHPA